MGVWPTDLNALILHRCTHVHLPWHNTLGGNSDGTKMRSLLPTKETWTEPPASGLGLTQFRGGGTWWAFGLWECVLSPPLKQLDKKNSCPTKSRKPFYFGFSLKRFLIWPERSGRPCLAHAATIMNKARPGTQLRSTANSAPLRAICSKAAGPNKIPQGLLCYSRNFSKFMEKGMNILFWCKIPEIHAVIS